MNVNLSTFGMNAGLDSDEDLLLWNLDTYSDHFYKVFVCDGKMTPAAKEHYLHMSDNVKVFDLPWDDNYEKRYRLNSSQVDDGEFVLHLDADEVPSKELIKFIKSDEFKHFISEGVNMFLIPCILHLRGPRGRFYAAEAQPEKQFKGQWVKKILFKKSESLTFNANGSHVIPSHGISEKAIYIPHPYFHLKTLESFVQNDAWQAFLSPQGQWYTQVEASLFKRLTRQFNSTSDFKKATKEGSWPLPLQKFAWDKRKEFNRPISRLSWVYWILNKNTCPFGDFDLTWDEVKNYVLSKETMNIFNENIKNDKYLEI